MRRYEDWPSRLDRWLAETAGRAFSWGRHDCYLAASDAVLAMTGIDPAAELRGRYRTAHQGYCLARKLSGGGVAEMFETAAGRHGFPEILPKLAQRGDIVTLEAERDSALAVCLGACVVGAGREGMASAPLSSARRAWRI